jgi:hypothetical protein
MLATLRHPSCKASRHLARASWHLARLNISSKQAKSFTGFRAAANAGSSRRGRRLLKTRWYYASSAAVMNEVGAAVEAQVDQFIYIARAS